jgi:DNA mismatch repair protein MutS
MLSVLFEREGCTIATSPPACFADLHLDQLVEMLTAGHQDYKLGPFFWSPLHDASAVRYRQEVAQDLEQPEIAACIKSFTEEMRRARSYLRGMCQVHGRHFQEGWFLDAAESYCAAVATLHEGLHRLSFRAQAFHLLRGYLDRYVGSLAFTSLRDEARRLRSELTSVRYSLLIRGSRVTVAAYEEDRAYSDEIEEVFARFRQGAVKDFRANFADQRDANHVQALVLERVARIYPELFSRLEAFSVRRKDMADATVVAFDREAQFYLAYLDLLRPLRHKGMPFCYPEIRPSSEGAAISEGFDLILALKNLGGEEVVRNDAYLGPGERALVVTGPNQGGKTTFARMFGQVHYLASLGLPVPGRGASLSLPDQIFTHFERQERLESLSGKLEDELLRARDILAHASPESVVVMNESFSSTTVADASFIGRRVLERLLAIGALCVFVTFIDELSSLSEATVSMVAEVLPEDPSVRTFKLTRRPADGRAYAMALARKHGLTYAQLRERVPR